jgi:predicted transcriptional regulator
MTASLGELEKQVMDIIWDTQSASVRCVLQELKKERKIAYTTVATILQRLYEKKLVLKKEEKTGFTYQPNISREDYIKSLSHSFLSSLVSSFGDMAIASFAHSIEDLPKKKKQYFLDMLNSYETKK